MKKAIIYQDVYDAIKATPESIRGELSLATLAYAFDDDISVSDNASTAFNIVKALLDPSRRISAVRAEAGRKGGIASVLSKSSKIKQNQAKNVNQLESEDYVKQTKQNQANQAKEEKERDKEKEISPCTPLEEKEINKEKEDIICASNKFDTRRTTSSRMPKPTLSEVNEYILSMGYTFSGEEFIAFYESNGWKVGRNPMKSWKAACRTWQGNKPKNTPQGSLPTGISEQEWSKFNTWRTNHAPDISIDPQAYLDIKCLSHRKSNVVADMLIEANAARANDVVAYCKQLAAKPPYYARIWAD